MGGYQATLTQAQGNLLYTATDDSRIATSWTDNFDNSSIDSAWTETGTPVETTVLTLNHGDDVRRDLTARRELSLIAYLDGTSLGADSQLLAGYQGTAGTTPDALVGFQNTSGTWNPKSFLFGNEDTGGGGKKEGWVRVRVMLGVYAVSEWAEVASTSIPTEDQWTMLAVKTAVITKAILEPRLRIFCSRFGGAAATTGTAQQMTADWR